VVEPEPKLPDPPLRLCVWLSVARDDPLCDWKGEGICAGEDTFFEVARERAGLDDMALWLEFRDDLVQKDCKYVQALLTLER